MVLFIAAVFIAASVVFLPDKKSISDVEREEVESAKSDEQAEELGQEQKDAEEEKTQKEVTPEETVDDEIQAIINDMQKQEASFETEISYLN